MLYQTPMVQGILNDIKTETRRDKNLKEINENPNRYGLIYFGTGNMPKSKKQEVIAMFSDNDNNLNPVVIKCPWRVGNILWVKETWKPSIILAEGAIGEYPVIRYKADSIEVPVPPEEYEWFTELTRNGKFTWQSSMFLRRIFARTFLKVTEVGIQRLHEITWEDCLAEGIEREWDGTAYWYKNYAHKPYPAMFKQDPIASYKSLWERINGAGSWATNPYIWYVRFEKLKGYAVQ